MHEVQPYLTVSNHGYLGYAVIVNKKFWDGLPGNIRSELEGAMKEATGYANAIAQIENDAAMESIKQSGKTKVYTLSEAEKNQWRNALAPVRVQMEARIGRDLILAVSREAAGTARQATSK
jgi:C4-dicarboxylate-binding protein DctP